LATRFIAHVFAAISDDTIYSGAFADNAASLRIQEKLGFARDGEAMFYSNPNRKEMPHHADACTILRGAYGGVLIQLRAITNSYRRQKVPRAPSPARARRYKDLPRR
jgi:RimJ/RimL family protein N-acetyltransferase